MARDCTCGVQGFDHSATCPACTDYDPTVVIVTLDDWQIMYVSGRKVLETHRIPLHDIAAAVGYQLEVRNLMETDFDAGVSESGVTPERLEDVPAE